MFGAYFQKFPIVFSSVTDDGIQIVIQKRRNLWTRTGIRFKQNSTSLTDRQVLFNEAETFRKTTSKEWERERESTAHGTHKYEKKMNESI